MKLALLVCALAAPAGAQVQQQCVTSALAGGTGDALTVPLLPCGLATNLLVLTLSATNSGSSPTLQMVGYSALPIVNADGSGVGPGTLVSGTTVLLNGTGSQWRLLASGVTEGSGTVTTSGSPVAGNLTKFTGSTVISNGDLSGDVTTSGTLAATLAPSGVTPGTYGDGGDYPVFTVDSKGRLTSASQVALSGSSADLTLYGNGADGDVTVSSGRTGLTRDMYYHNLTISGTGTLDTQGYRVFVSGTLNISSAPYNGITLLASVGGSKNGASASGSGATGAVTGTQGETVGGSSSSAGGATGKTGAGTAGTIGFNPSTGKSLVTASGASGAGGAGSSGAGGALAAGQTAVAEIGNVYRLTTELYVFKAGNIFYFSDTGPSGGSGGSGGGDGSNAGGGGGAGGAAGGCVFVAAKTINRGAGTAAGAINADGGNGGNGGSASAGNAGGGGGASGGAGGLVYLIYKTLTGSTATGAVSARGGSGGSGGNGIGTGVGGDGGAAASPGRIMIWNSSAATLVESDENTTTVAGGTHSGATGGTGAAAASQLQNL